MPTLLITEYAGDSEVDRSEFRVEDIAGATTKLTEVLKNTASAEHVVDVLNLWSERGGEVLHHPDGPGSSSSYQYLQRDPIGVHPRRTTHPGIQKRAPRRPVPPRKREAVRVRDEAGNLLYSAQLKINGRVTTRQIRARNIAEAVEKLLSEPRHSDISRVWQCVAMGAELEELVQRIRGTERG